MTTNPYSSSVSRGFLNPKSFEEAETLAKYLANHKLVPIPRDLNFSDKKACADFVAELTVRMNKGMEAGLTAMQGIEGVLMNRGKPLIWGDIFHALCKRQPDYGYVKVEYDDKTETATCNAYRKNVSQPITITYSRLEVQKAKLDQNPTYQKHMRLMIIRRALNLALRYAWPEASAGMCTVEEVIEEIPQHIVDEVLGHKLILPPKDDVPLDAREVPIPSTDTPVEPTSGT